MKKYTLEQICEAWAKFTQPKWLISRSSLLRPEDLENMSMMEFNEEDGIKQLPIDYSRWIPFLISYKHKK